MFYTHTHIHCAHTHKRTHISSFSSGAGVESSSVGSERDERRHRVTLSSGRKREEGGGTERGGRRNRERKKERQREEEGETERGGRREREKRKERQRDMAHLLYYSF